MNAAVVAGLVVAALLVGAALPVLAQARVSLRAWQRMVEEVGPRLGKAADDVSGVAGALRRELGAFDGAGERVGAALRAVDDLGRAAVELQRTARVAAAIGAAVGPGIAAAIRTFKAPPSAANGHNSKEGHHEAA
jgi:hypothetical protein